MLTLHPLGQTSVLVSKLGLGLAALGRPGYLNLGHGQDLSATQHDRVAMEAHAHAVLDAAYAAGVRYFDAARSYGEGEAFLGNWLRTRRVKTDEVAIGSKWGYTYTANWQVQADQHEVKSHTRPVLDRQWEETQVNLGPYLDIYQVHSATLSSGVLQNATVLDRLGELKAAGTQIGLSLSGAGQAETLRQALQVQVDGKPLFSVVQATWNVLERSVGDALAEAHAAGMGVIIKEALANGRLTSRNEDPSFSVAKEILLQQAQRLHTTIDALALALVMAQPWVDVVLSGAAQIAHLEANLAVHQVEVDAEAAAALSALTEPAEAYWSYRSNMTWN